MYAYSAMRRSGLAHPNTLAIHWTVGSAVFTAFGAGGYARAAATWTTQFMDWRTGDPLPPPAPREAGKPTLVQLTSSAFRCPYCNAQLAALGDIEDDHRPFVPPDAFDKPAG